MLIDTAILGEQGVLTPLRMIPAQTTAAEPRPLAVIAYDLRVDAGRRSAGEDYRHRRARLGSLTRMR